MFHIIVHEIGADRSVVLCTVENNPEPIAKALREKVRLVGARHWIKQYDRVEVREVPNPS
jgi:hypothetical protein